MVQTYERGDRLSQKFNFDKEYGLVLEGGGAKGAYQIGVWRAFLEYGVKIKGISGVSVGALNGALMCMGDYERAESLWENISYSQVMNVDDIKIDNIIKRNFSAISFRELRKDTAKLITDKGIDATPLMELIDEYIDEDTIRNSPMEFIIGIFSMSKKRELGINVRDIDPGLIRDYLMGSAYHPTFKKEKLHGEKYLDGGVFNNVPINYLIDRAYKDIIVIRIFGKGLEKNIKIPEDVNIIEIAPRVNLGNVLEFDSKKSRRNLKIGYYDGLRCLRGLEGNDYYIEETHSEEYYIKLLAEISKKTAKKLFDLYHIKNNNITLTQRKLFEEAYPSLAKDLKLEKEWNYKDLFLAILETCGKDMNIQKYNIYTEAELYNKICKERNKIELGACELNPITDIAFDLLYDIYEII